MALPSQTARISASRSPMFRRKRTSARPFVVAGGVALTVVVLGIAWSLGGTRPADGKPPAVPPPLSSTDRIADAGKTATPPQPRVEIPQAPPQAPQQESKQAQRQPAAPPVLSAVEPVVINQGQASRPASESPKLELKEEPKPAAPVQPDPAPPKANPGPSNTASPAAPTPNPTNAHTPSTTLGVSGLPAEIQGLVLEGRQKSEAHQLVAARQLLSRALAHPKAPESERARLRDELAKISDELVFSPRPAADDPYVAVYAVQSGDGLERIAKRNGVQTHWRMIQRVNGLSNPNRVRLNQKLKLVKGPFHAVVNKSAFRMDIYMGPAETPAEWVYVRSFRVGLGEKGGTPIGEFIVRKGSKLENPYWTNPRTGEQFGKDDPNNPIGERWIGIEGVGDSSVHHSLGIHGTIDPDSIGQEKSMGCVRLGAQDVELVYDLLGEGVSRVRIVP